MAMQIADCQMAHSMLVHCSVKESARNQMERVILTLDDAGLSTHT